MEYFIGEDLAKCVHFINTTAIVDSQAGRVVDSNSFPTRGRSDWVRMMGAEQRYQE